MIVRQVEIILDDKERQEDGTQPLMLIPEAAGETHVLEGAVLAAIRQPPTYRRSNGGYTCAHCLGFGTVGGKTIE